MMGFRAMNEESVYQADAEDIPSEVSDEAMETAVAAQESPLTITNPGAGNCGGQRGVAGLDTYLYGGRRVPGLSSRSPGSHRFYF